MERKKKGSQAQIIRKKQKKSPTSDRKKEGRESKSRNTQLKKYNRIAEEYERDSNKRKRLSDYAKKGLTIQEDSVNPEILDNVWNVHHTRTDKHPKIVMARRGDEYLISHTTTESRDKDKKIQIQDGLLEKQKTPTFVKVTTKIIHKDKLQSRIKGTRITTRDKVHIYDSVKDRATNKKKYQDLGNKKDRTESVSAYQGSHSRKSKG